MTDRTNDIYQITRQILLNKELVKKMTRDDVVDKTYEYLIDEKKVEGINLPQEVDEVSKGVIGSIGKLKIFGEYASPKDKKNVKFKFDSEYNVIQIEDHFATVFTDKDLMQDEMKEILKFLKNKDKKIDTLAYINYENGTTKAISVIAKG